MGKTESVNFEGFYQLKNNRKVSFLIKKSVSDSDISTKHTNAFPSSYPYLLINHGYNASFGSATNIKAEFKHCLHQQRNSNGCQKHQNGLDVTLPRFNRLIHCVVHQQTTSTRNV